MWRASEAVGDVVQQCLRIRPAVVDPSKARLAKPHLAGATILRKPARQRPFDLPLTRQHKFTSVGIGCQIPAPCRIDRDLEPAFDKYRRRERGHQSTLTNKAPEVV